MDRYWLLTNTTYGTWLPGDSRGFVGRVLDRRPGDELAGDRVTHNVTGTPYDRGISGLAQRSATLSHPPVALSLRHAEIVRDQFRETARYRKWVIRAGAVMWNHFHLVVGVWGDPDPSKILGDFKNYGTRALSRVFGKPPSETWWAECGSKRKLATDEAVATRIEYVLFRQPNPLVTWSDSEPDLASVGA